MLAAQELPTRGRILVTLRDDVAEVTPANGNPFQSGIFPTRGGEVEVSGPVCRVRIQSNDRRLQPPEDLPEGWQQLPSGSICEVRPDGFDLILRRDDVLLFVEEPALEAPAPVMCLKIHFDGNGVQPELVSAQEVAHGT